MEGKHFFLKRIAAPSELTEGSLIARCGATKGLSSYIRRVERVEDEDGHAFHMEPYVTAVEQKRSRSSVLNWKTIESEQTSGDGLDHYMQAFEIETEERHFGVIQPGGFAGMYGGLASHVSLDHEELHLFEVSQERLQGSDLQVDVEIAVVSEGKVQQIRKIQTIKDGQITWKINYHVDDYKECQWLREPYFTGRQVRTLLAAGNRYRLVTYLCTFVVPRS